MSYVINKSNNELFLILNDNIIDKNNASISLVGRNVSNFGDAQNENFLHMLENFARSSAVGGQPRSPITGQIWFDTNSNILRPLTYDGRVWRPLAVSIYSPSVRDTLTNASSSPAIPFAASQPGDFWVNSVTKQMYVVTSTASDVSLIGPEFVEGFATTKMSSRSMNDSSGTARPVIQTIINGEVISIQSNITFVQTSTNAVAGFPIIYRGVTYKNYSSSTRYSTLSTDVVLHGLHAQLDQSYPRRNIDERIQSNWSVDTGNTFYFGSSQNSGISWNSSASSLALVSTSNISFRTSATGLIFSGDALFPTVNSLIDLGSNTYSYKAIYARRVDSGVTTGTIGGNWKIDAATEISPNTDLSSNIGTASSRFGNVFTPNLSAGNSGNQGILTGAWQLSANSTFSPLSNLSNNIGLSNKKFNTIYVSTVSGIASIVGSPVLAGNLLPSVTGTYELGNTNFQWLNLYATTVRSSNLISTTGTIRTFTATNATISSVTATNINTVNITASGSIDAPEVYINGYSALTATYVLNTASSVVLGGIKVGNGISVSSSGTISVVTYNQSLNTSNSVTFNNISINNITAGGVFTAPVGTISNFNANTATISGNLTVNSAGIVNATINSLNSPSATITRLSGGNSTFNNVTATVATISTLTVSTLIDRFSTSINKIDTDSFMIANSDSNLATQRAIVSYVARLLSQLPSIPPVPTGAVFYVAMQALPNGYVICNGGSYSTTDSRYLNLFNAIGYTYGGSGNTFRVPDLRGQFIRGHDAGRGVDAGRAFGSAQSDDIVSHSHYMFANVNSAYNNMSSYPEAAPSSNTSGGSSGSSYNIGTDGVSDANEGRTSAVGGTETRPKNVALMPIIKL